MKTTEYCTLSLPRTKQVSFTDSKDMLKHFTFSLRHQRKAKPVNTLGVAPHFEKIPAPVGSRTTLKSWGPDGRDLISVSTSKFVHYGHKALEKN
jgi:hypothetical protein